MTPSVARRSMFRRMVPVGLSILAVAGAFAALHQRSRSDRRTRVARLHAYFADVRDAQMRYAHRHGRFSDWLDDLDTSIPRPAHADIGLMTVGQGRWRMDARLVGTDLRYAATEASTDRIGRGTAEPGRGLGPTRLLAAGR